MQTVTPSASSAVQSSPAIAAAPAHLARAHIVDFDYLRPAGMEGGDVYTALVQLHALMPPVTYSGPVIGMSHMRLTWDA